MRFTLPVFRMARWTGVLVVLAFTVVLLGAQKARGSELDFCTQYHYQAGSTCNQGNAHNLTRVGVTPNVLGCASYRPDNQFAWDPSYMHACSAATGQEVALDLCGCIARYAINHEHANTIEYMSGYLFY